MRDVFCALGPGVRGNVLDEQPPTVIHFIAGGYFL